MIWQSIALALSAVEEPPQNKQSPSGSQSPGQKHTSAPHPLRPNTVDTRLQPPSPA